MRLPPQTLRVTTAGRMACSARQLVASTEGSHSEGKYGREFVGEVGSEAPRRIQPRRLDDQPTESREQPAADGCETVVARIPGVSAVAELEGVLEDGRAGGSGSRCARAAGPGRAA